MKSRNFICKLVFFAAVLTLLLSLAACATAEDCTEANHVGPINVIKILEPTCTENGQQIKVCQNCGKTVATEPIIAQGHPFGNVRVQLKPPTCTEAGKDQVQKKCAVCGYIDSTWEEDVAALGHDYPDDWTIVKQPTCEETGTRQKVCRRNSAHVITDTIAALGHNYGDWVVTKQPTCEGKGTETRTCSRDSSHTENRDIAPLGHLWGPEVTTPATCVAAGSVKQVCQRDSSHVNIVRTIPIDSNAHDWGPYVTTTKPTCTTKGVETSTCSRSSAHIRTRELPIDPDAHVWDNGTVIKQPSVMEKGIKEYVCTLNSSHKKQVELDTIRLNNNTVCAFGPRLRETNLYPFNTDAWYMFTPFDASKDGTQTYDLVASNQYIVGSVTLTIKDGNLKVDYTIADQKKFTITLEFFTVLHRIGDLTTYEPEELQGLRMNKGQFISLEENFGDDTNLVLYFCSRCNLSYSQKFSFLNYKSAANQRLLADMKALMD